MGLLEEIRKKQHELVVLAQEKDNVLSDPEVYRFSCIVDEMIVKLMKDERQARKGRQVKNYLS